MRAAIVDGGCCRGKGLGERVGSPLGARSFHMYKGAKRLNDEYRNGQTGRTKCTDGTRKRLSPVITRRSRFLVAVFFFPAVRSFTRLSAGLFEKYRRLLCQLLIKTTTGCAARATG